MRNHASMSSRSRTGLAAAALAAAGILLIGCTPSADSGGDGGAAPEDETIEVAFLSFAVANTYDTPMLEAAQEVADANNVTLTVFDANNDPTAQASQLQDAIASGQFQGIITQPIYGPGLIEGVEQAIEAGIKVVNVDQILGEDFTTAEVQVEGLSANVSQRPAEMGRKLGEQVVAACAAQNLDPCNVAYLYDIKASALDVALREAWDEAVAGSPVQVVAEGESFFNPANALTVVQDILTAHPEVNVISASDQGTQGADQALEAAGRTGEVTLVGYGGSEFATKAVADGRVFSSVAMVPATSGRLAMEAIIDAIRNGNDQGSVDPFADLPNDWVITRETASEFSPEWPG